LKYKVYDGYLTETLAQTREYFKFIQTNNMGGTAKYNNHMKEYVNTKIETKFPDFID
jgi:hypothetical protein